MNPVGNTHFSIVVPTFHEAKNIPALISRIAQTDFGSDTFELIFADDNSQDGTEEIVTSLQPQYPWLRLLIRKDKKGLSESVIEGLKHARYPIWVIMDADLSHPPEKIPVMLAALAEPDVDLVIGSRYVVGGSSDEKWPFIRRAVSRLAALIARMIIAVPVKDPLSGFLALRKSTICSGAKLEPVGWKIGLEIMVKCRCKRIKEVPIHFSQRVQGTSKLNLKVVINYFQHINRLVWFKAFY